MPAQPAKHKTTSFEEVIEELRPHEKAIKFAVIVFSFVFVWFSIVYSSNVSAALDGDGDGFSNAAETYIGTDPSRVCVSNGWPPDINNDGKVDIFDVNLLAPPHFNVKAGDANYLKRYDLNADNQINLQDVLLINPYFLKKCTELFPTQAATLDTLKIDLGNGVDPPPQGTVGQVYAGSNLAVHVFSQKLNRWLNSSETTLTYTGSLPPGLVLNDILDFIYGKPTAAGRYDFSIRAFSKPTNVSATKAVSITVNPALPPAPTCTGTMTLVLSPESIVVGQVSSVTATVSGLNNCGGSDVLHFFIQTTSGKQYVGPRYLKDPPSITLTAPSTPYPSGYLVEVYLDKGGDASAGGPYDLGPASAYLNVLAPPPPPPPPTPPPPPPTPPPPPPVIGDPGKDAIREYIKNYVGGWNVRRTIGGYGLNFGRFLWGLAGCESTWDPSDNTGDNGAAFGLFQYHKSTWNSTVAEARKRGANVGDDIWNYQHQVQVTVWKVSPNGGGDYPQAWSCWNNWLSGGRNWTWFTDEWPDPNF